MNRPDQHQPGRPTASQALAAYEALEEEAGAAREISNDLSTDEGMNACLLADEAEKAYAEYQAAWFSENYPGGALEVEAASEPEPEAGQ